MSIYYNNYYYSYDDEGFMSTIGTTMVDIPNLFINDYKDGNFLNYFDEIINFSHYINFCKNLNIEFVPQYDNHYYTSYEEIKNSNINFKCGAAQITNMFLENFIVDLKNEINQNNLFYNHFNFQINYLNNSPPGSELFYQILFKNKIFLVSYTGLVFTLIDKLIKPYCIDLMSLPYYLMLDNEISKEHYIVYQKWLNKKDYLISKKENIYDFFWNHCLNNDFYL